MVGGSLFNCLKGGGGLVSWLCKKGWCSLISMILLLGSVRGLTLILIVVEW